MADILIGLAIGVGGELATVILFFVLLRSSGERADRATTRGDAREKELALELDETKADRDAAREAEKILHDNQAALFAELADLRTGKASAEARLASVTKDRDDLVQLLHDQPGALPDAVRLAANRLRALVSGSAAVPPAASADPARREAGAVHADDPRGDARGSNELERP